MRCGILTCDLHDCRIHFSQAKAVYIPARECDDLQGYKVPGSRRLMQPWTVSHGCVCSKNSDLWFAYFIYDGVKDKNRHLAEGH